MLMTLLAVTRAELGMVTMGRRSIRCGAGSGASPRFSGGCWPASPNVALAGVAASGREYAIRVRGRATTVVPEAATPGLPDQPGPNRPLPGVAADHKSSYARIRPPLPPGGWPRAGPPLTREPRSLREGITRAGRTRAMRIEPATLATSIGILTTLEPSEGSPRSPADGGRGQAPVRGRTHAGPQG
jgi:hypothetical protein